MKVVDKTEERKSFKPVTLEITLESEEELKYLFDVAQLDSSVPELLRGFNGFKLCSNNPTERLHKIVFLKIQALLGRRLEQ